MELLQQQLLAYAHDLATSHRRLQATYLATLHALANAVENRDEETAGHSQRVTRYSLALARALGVPETGIRQVEYGALLHDVGKIGIPDAILRKPGRLTHEEWVQMRRHPDIGHRMLQEIEFLQDALPIVRQHHERFDGKGYPQGLGGKEIALGARIFAVADALDAITSDRPYRQAAPFERAREEILRQRGRQFDPDVVEAFLGVFERLPAIAHGDGATG
ncbi:MAG: HD-GYP domain-containing protein [Chloroflexi bacterium]|nr:HD-GYP domain-containing protein [Chloroflexota bacterium]